MACTKCQYWQLVKSESKCTTMDSYDFVGFILSCFKSHIFPVTNALTENAVPSSFFLSSFFTLKTLYGADLDV